MAVVHLPFQKHIDLVGLDVDQLPVRETPHVGVRPGCVKGHNQVSGQREFSVEPRVQNEIDGPFGPV